MRKNKTLILIAAIAVMLAAATNAYGYYETWSDWFCSAALLYNDNYYSCTSDEGYAHCRTYSEDRDTFYVDPEDWVVILTFYQVSYSPPPPDTLWFYLFENGTEGGKETGRSGTKDGEGVWDADVYESRNGNLVKIFDIAGSWEATFDYSETPPQYSASFWEIICTIPDVELDGISDGYCTYYSETTPP